MSSRDGFARADIDTNIFHDPKVLALARRHRDPARTACAVMLYEATLLASWKAGQRLTITEAAPAWWLDDPADPLADLQAVQLLDGEGRVPQHAFDAWTARARTASESARAAAEARWDKVRAAATAAQSDSLGNATAVRPESDGNATAMPSLPAGRPAEPARQSEPPARDPAANGAGRGGPEGIPFHERVAPPPGHRARPPEVPA